MSHSFSAFFKMSTSFYKSISAGLVGEVCALLSSVILSLSGRHAGQAQNSHLSFLIIHWKLTEEVAHHGLMWKFKIDAKI